MAKRLVKAAVVVEFDPLAKAGLGLDPVGVALDFLPLSNIGVTSFCAPPMA